jgi:hypothetical protein
LLDRLRRPEAALDACRADRTLGRQGDGAQQHFMEFAGAAASNRALLVLRGA